MGSDITKGVVLVVVGLLMATPFLVVAAWMVLSQIRLFMVAPSVAWTLWAVPAAGVTGMLLTAIGAYLIVRSRRTRVRPVP